MIQIFQSTDNTLNKIDQISPGCWVQVIQPTPEEITFLESQGILHDFIKYALDEEEIVRVETDKQQTLIIMDVPSLPESTDGVIYSTASVAFIFLETFVVTITAHPTGLFNEMEKHPRLNTGFKTRMLLQFFGKTAQKYLTNLKEIEHIKNLIEARAVKSISNKEIMELMKLQKSLVYFTTSLRADESLLDRIRQGKIIPLYEEDNAIMDDVLIEIKQAKETADIHERILGNTMDNYGSIIANNMNDIMKVLTSFTLLLSIPMIIFGFYGMNVQGLWFPETPYVAIGISLVFTILTAVLFIRRRML